MRYRTNQAGVRVVDATPEDIRALRPSIAACLRSRRLSENDIDDFCQEVEIVAWTALVDGRISGGPFARPVDALLRFMMAVAWNLWRNHRRRSSTRSEALVDELPDVPGPSPDGRINARETLLRLTAREDITNLLLDAINVSSTGRNNVPRSTFGVRLTNARSVARDIESGRYREPRQPIPPSPRHRKKGR